MVRNFFALGAALALAAALPGCSKVSTAQAVQFNDAIVAAGNRVSASGRAFGQSVGKAIGGGVMEVAMAKREYENVTEALDRAKSDMKVIKVPDSPSARKFYDEFQKLLARQDEVVREDFKAIVKVLDDPLITPEVRLKKLMPILNYLWSLDLNQMRELKAAQAVFASEHNFQIKK